MRDPRRTISVAMATYNGVRFIGAQLDSIQRQSRLPDELVVTDDGSSDDTVALVERFASRAAFPVRIHRNPGRLTYRNNFMCNVSLCRSDLIAFSDQDDVWHEDKLQRAAVLFDDPEMLLVHHDAYVVREDMPWAARRDERLGKPIRPSPVLEPMTNPAWAFSQGFTQMMDRKLVRFSNFWNRSICRYDQRLPDSHDRWFFFLASVFGRIGFIDLPLADYRQHGQNVFGIPQKRNVWFEKVRATLENRSSIYRDLGRQSGRRAEILDGIARTDTLSETWRARARHGAERFEHLAELYRHRHALYASPRLPARFRHLRDLTAQHAYDPQGSWHFGAKALLKDAVLGGLLGPLVLRHGTVARGGDPMCWPGSAPAAPGRDPDAARPCQNA